MTSPTRVAIVEDNHITQLGLKTFIDDLDEFQIVGVFANVIALYRFLDKDGADILILDDSIPSLDTAAILRYLHFNFRELKIIVFGTDLYAPLIHEYLEEKALGYIYKEEQLNYCLAEGLNAVRRGQVYTSHMASQVLLTATNHKRSLSKRAYQVLKGMDEGITAADIAKRLGITPKAVYSAQERLREHFGVRTNEEVVEEARRQRIFKRSPPENEDHVDDSGSAGP